MCKSYDYRVTHISYLTLTRVMEDLRQYPLHSRTTSMVTDLTL